MFHRILVALDHRSNSEQVFETALALAKDHQATLMLLHVLSPVADNYPSQLDFSLGAAYPDLYEELCQVYLKRQAALENIGLEQLRSLAAKASAVGVNAEFTQTTGKPGAVICDLARTWKADLIVMGRRRHSKLGEWFMGSSSNYVLHHAPCSVLAIQPLVQVVTAQQPSDQQLAAV